ncbi:hypothetical protein ZOSMA_112G00480 [Zostera marina]|uniref:Bifunctional inhibitor/plant lipid transfer protein/seed storage helical domain-containing protein n=1 Tax=Zostera marina TaxID=29655 RepID=A0A0K9Q560_ZOSMR|nr:hypothetical protein ZOSMA_112G00480 [Zostera marina]
MTLLYNKHLPHSLLLTSPFTFSAMKTGSNMVMFMGLVLLLLLVGAPTSLSADNCQIAQFEPCIPALTSTAQPSNACCSSLHGKNECYCQLKNTPIFQRYYSPSTAHKIASACRMSIPHC